MFKLVITTKIFVLIEVRNHPRSCRDYNPLVETITKPSQIETKGTPRTYDPNLPFHIILKQEATLDVKIRLGASFMDIQLRSLHKVAGR